MLEDGKTFAWRWQFSWWSTGEKSLSHQTDFLSKQVARSKYRRCIDFEWDEFIEHFEKTKNERVNIFPNLRNCYQHQIAVRSHRHFWRSCCYRTICLWISYRHHSMPVEWSCALHPVLSPSSRQEYVFASDPCAESSPNRSRRSHRYPHCLHPFLSLSKLTNRRSRIGYRVHTTYNADNIGNSKSLTWKWSLVRLIHSWTEVHIWRNLHLISTVYFSLGIYCDNVETRQ